jgi:aminodeoxyfutalosine deaminase
MDLLTFARRIPKAELHVHLEGSIRPATLLQLAARNGIRLPASDERGLREFYRFRDFAHFVEVYVAVSRCLRTPDDYRLVAYEFGAEMARQNTRYAEATFTMSTNMRLTGLPWQEILAGLNEGRRQAHTQFRVDWRWVFDICRDNPDTQTTILEIALEAREDGVVALGLGGSEALFPPDLFSATFERARQAGLPRVPHAGETAGPASIWTALRALHADRIGHGVRAAEDARLVRHLRDAQIPLEICPTSNIRLGVYRDYASHPLRHLWEQGLLITVNSDDPPMFGTDLVREYELLVTEFGFDAGMIEQVSLNGVRAALLTPGEKAQLEAVFRREIAGLKADLEPQAASG